MSKHDALQFLQKVKTDEDIVNQLRVLVAGEGTSEAASLVSVAASFGFSFSEVELQEAIDELRAAELEQVDSLEISDSELEQVAGGAYKHVNYVGTYEEGENCTFDDSCSSAFRYYKVIDYCEYTYDPSKRCLFLEQN